MNEQETSLSYRQVMIRRSPADFLLDESVGCLLLNSARGAWGVDYPLLERDRRTVHETLGSHAVRTPQWLILTD